MLFDSRLAAALALPLAFALGCDNKSSQPAPAASSSTTSAATSAAPVASPSVTATPGIAPSDALPNQITYTTYKNAKYAYSVDVASVYSSDAPILGDAGHEWRMGNRAFMNVAAVDSQGKALKQWYDEAKKEPGILDATLNADWFMKTGKRDGKIFWQKSILKDNRLISARFEYAENLKSYFDPIVSRASSTLRSP
jgi:hypothetical protein